MFFAKCKMILNARSFVNGEVIFYTMMCVESSLVIISLMFFDTQWWQFLGMLVVMLETIFICLCYRYRYHSKFFQLEGDRGRFTRFYQWIEIYLPLIFWLFCPMSWSLT